MLLAVLASGHGMETPGAPLLVAVVPAGSKLMAMPEGNRNSGLQNFQNDRRAAHLEMFVASVMGLLCWLLAGGVAISLLFRVTVIRIHKNG